MQVFPLFSVLWNVMMFCLRATFLWKLIVFSFVTFSYTYFFSTVYSLWICPLVFLTSWVPYFVFFFFFLCLPYFYHLREYRSISQLLLYFLYMLSLFNFKLFLDLWVLVSLLCLLSFKFGCWFFFNVSYMSFFTTPNTWETPVFFFFNQLCPSVESVSLSPFNFSLCLSGSRFHHVKVMVGCFHLLLMRCRKLKSWKPEACTAVSASFPVSDLLGHFILGSNDNFLTSVGLIS